MKISHLHQCITSAVQQCQQSQWYSGIDHRRNRNIENVKSGAQRCSRLIIRKQSMKGQVREALDWWGELWQIYSLLVSLSATICSHISSLAQTFVSRWGIPFTCFLFSLPLPCFYSKVSSQLLILSQYCCINTMLTCSATFLSFTIASLASDALNALWNSHSWHVYVQYSSGQDIAYHLWRGER